MQGLGAELIGTACMQSGRPTKTDMYTTLLPESLRVEKRGARRCGLGKPNSRELAKHGAQQISTRGSLGQRRDQKVRLTTIAPY